MRRRLQSDTCFVDIALQAGWLIAQRKHRFNYQAAQLKRLTALS